MAKQGWTGVSSKAASKPTEAPTPASSLESRPPLGTLPQFIPLGGDSSEEDAEGEPIYATLKQSSEQEQKEVEAVPDAQTTGEGQDDGNEVDERLI